MMATLGSLLLPAALFLGVPHDGPAVYERGLFCNTIELVEAVVAFADQGGDPRIAVRDVNSRLHNRACFYATSPEVLAQTVRFERNIHANNTTYSIYQVSVSALGHQASEFGDLVWTFSQPVLMYTLRDGSTANTGDQ